MARPSCMLPKSPSFRTSSTLIVALALAIISGTGHAQPLHYVSDSCEVTLRTGHSTSHRIVKMVPSGAPLKVLQTDTESGYTQVRTADGKEGWMLSRFIMAEPPAREQLETYQDKIASIDEIEGQLNRRIAELEGLRQASEQQLASVTTERDRLASELDEIRRTGADAIALSNENASLRDQLQVTYQEKQALAAENQRLRDDTAQDWFVRGASVAGGGILVGLMLPHLRFRRRRDSWRSL